MTNLTYLTGMVEGSPRPTHMQHVLKEEARPETKNTATWMNGYADHPKFTRYSCVSELLGR